MIETTRSMLSQQRCFRKLALMVNTGEGWSPQSEVPYLDAAVRTHLGVQLRAIYQDQEPPLPTEQIELLLVLRRKEREHQQPGETASSQGQ